MFFSIVFVCVGLACVYEITPPMFGTVERCLLVSSMVAGIKGNEIKQSYRREDTRFSILCIDEKTNIIQSQHSTDQGIENTVNAILFQHKREQQSPN